MNMSLGTTLDLSNVQPAGEYTPLPEGVYKAICHEFSVSEKDYGVGAKVKFTIVEGKYTGRQISDHFSVIHRTSPQAQDISQRRLRAWCDALGLPPSLESGEVLLHRPVMIKLKVDQPRTVGDKTYGAQNRIETFYAADSATEAKSAPVLRAPAAAVQAKVAAPSPSPVAPTAAKSMPWKR